MLAQFLAVALLSKDLSGLLFFFHHALLSLYTVLLKDLNGISVGYEWGSLSLDLRM